MRLILEDGHSCPSVRSGRAGVLVLRLVAAAGRLVNECCQGVMPPRNWCKYIVMCSKNCWFIVRSMMSPPRIIAMA